MQLTERASEWPNRAGLKWVLPLLTGLSLVVFLLAPWSLQVKSLAALHGLCTQNPAHSFWFGGRRLPLDARMTGMYLGFVLTQLAFILTRRRGAGVPPVRYVVVLFGFMVAMAVDGTNSTLVDLRLPALYAPSNALRYATGSLAGITLAIFAWVLLGQIFPRLAFASQRPAIASAHDLVVAVLPVAAAGPIFSSGVPWLFAPLALLLVGCCVLLLAELALAGMGLVFQSIWESPSLRGLLAPASAALSLSYLAMFLLAAARFALEAHGLLGPAVGR